MPLNEIPAESISEIAEGLQLSGSVVTRIAIVVNTELPDDKVEVLKTKVAEAFAAQFNASSEIDLVSTEA